MHSISTVSVFSPGRVNLIGEHTDYNDGWVLPLAIDRGTTITARRRADNVLTTRVARFNNETDEVELSALDAGAQEGWRAYVRGTAQALLDAGISVVGADLAIDSDLPLSGGLSSSASLEVGVAMALLTLAGAALSPIDLALLAQRAEHQYAHVNCGIMDQLSVAAGQAHHATLIDCRSLDITPVTLPRSIAVLIVDSGVPRTLAGSAYNQRRAECEQAVAAIKHIDPSIHALRDVSSTLLAEAVERDLLDDVVYRRARHIVTENERVLAVVEAFKTENFTYVGELMNESHWSLRDDYEVSGPELDTLTELLRDMPGVLGARLTGAGFGGSCVALVQQEHVATVAAQIVPAYNRATGRSAEAFSTQASELSVHIETDNQPSCA